MNDSAHNTVPQAETAIPNKLSDTQPLKFKMAI
jgi:hypothetical protein